MKTFKVESTVVKLSSTIHCVVQKIMNFVTIHVDENILRKDQLHVKIIFSKALETETD